MHHRLNQRIEHDAVESVARGLAHHRDPVVQSGGVEVRQVHLGGVAIVAEAGQPDDVGDPAGELQHPGSVAADEQRDGHAGRSDESPASARTQ